MYNLPLHSQNWCRLNFPSLTTFNRAGGIVSVVYFLKNNPECVLPFPPVWTPLALLDYPTSYKAPPILMNMRVL